MSFIGFNRYNNNQIILSSDRLIFNAKKDNIFFLAKNDISISAGNSVHIDLGGKNSIFVVNSPEIQFGLPDADNTLESVAKGDTSVDIFSSILNDLYAFMVSLTTTKGVVSGGVATLPGINIAAKDMIEKIKLIKQDLNKIKSKTTFTT